MASSQPADTDIPDPIALQLRDAWARALRNPQQEEDLSQQAPEPGPQVTGLTPSGVGGSGTQAPSNPTQGTQATASTGSPTGSQGNTRQEVEQLRAQVQTLQSQHAAQQAENAANAQTRQQLATIQQRSAELERLRQQRLVDLTRARTWMVAADQALEQGELDVSEELGEADSALAQVVQSSSDSGTLQSTALVQDARGMIAQALESAGHRDFMQARLYLLGADFRVREARRQNLDAPSATIATQ